MFKKLVSVVAVTTALTGSLSCLYANENQNSQEMKAFSYEFNAPVKTTGSSYNYDYDPVISDPQIVTIDSKLCVRVHVRAATSISEVRIDDKTATRRNGSSSEGDFYIEANGTKNYKVYARDANGRTMTRDNIYLTVSDSTKPTLSLSKKYKNGYCYLVIKAEDNNSISTVKVDGSTIDFSSSGETREYRVTQSKTYTVEVKDAAGNTTTEKIDINVNEDKPSLTLDKVLKDGKWYLTIKSYPSSGARISKVTVNNTKINFSSNGETLDYAVSSSGNYTVVVIDNYNQQESQTLYIDCSVTSDTYKPTLTATAKDMGGIMGIDVAAYPSTLISNNTLKQVTVNGIVIAIPAAGGRMDYMVTATGNYTVVATDASGNSSTQTVFVTVPTAQAAAGQTSSSSSSTTGSSKAVFKIKQKSYTLNGVKQPMEDGAPTIKNGRTMLPIRYVAYALNIEPKNIVWDGTTKIVTIYDGSNIIKAPLNSKKITVNGVDQTMEVAATMINGRVYIPISQIAKAFSGVSISWEPSTKEATISRN